jgi:hypothetical protein
MLAFIQYRVCCEHELFTTEVALSDRHEFSAVKCVRP